MPSPTYKHSTPKSNWHWHYGEGENTTSFRLYDSKNKRKTTELSSIGITHYSRLSFFTNENRKKLPLIKLICIMWNPWLMWHYYNAKVLPCENTAHSLVTKVLKDLYSFVANISPLLCYHPWTFFLFSTHPSLPSIHSIPSLLYIMHKLCCMLLCKYLLRGEEFLWDTQYWPLHTKKALLS